MTRTPIRVSKRDARSLLEIAQGKGVPAKPPRKSKLSKRELNPTEHVEQSFLVQRLAAEESKHPELALGYAVPNGGFRECATAAKLKAEGVKRSVPDYVLPVPRFPFHGLYVELKRIGYFPTEAQLTYHARLREQGYCVLVAQGAEEAYVVIMGYLAMMTWEGFTGKRGSIIRNLREQWHLTLDPAASRRVGSSIGV